MSGQLLAVGILDAVVAAVTRQADRTTGQLALGIDALVALDERVDHAHVPVEQRVAAQRLPLGAVDLAREDVDGGVVAQRVVDAARDVLLAAQAVDEPPQKARGAEVGGLAGVDQPVAAGMLGAEEAAVLRGGLVAEEGGEQLGQRVALLVEALQRVESRAAEVEGGLVAENRGGQRLAVAGQDAAPLGGDDLLGEDAAREAVGVVGHLAAEELHPDEAQQHDGRHGDEEHVEQPDPQQDVLLDG